MKILATIILISVLCLPCLSEEGGGAFASDSTEFTPINPPLPAPDISVTTLKGQTIALSDLRGRPIVLNFWATWCAPCVAEMPSLDRLAADRAQTPLAILAVSEDRGGEGAVGSFIQQHSLNSLPVFLDPKGNAAKNFSVDALPVTLLIDRQGREVGEFRGPVDWDSPAAKQAIDHLLGSAGPDHWTAAR